MTENERKAIRAAIDAHRKAIRHAIDTMAKDLDELRMLIGDKYLVILHDRVAVEDWVEEFKNNG